MVKSRFAGIVLASELCLGLTECRDHRKPDIRLIASNDEFTQRSEIHRFNTKAGVSWLSIGTDGRDYRLRFEGAADFIVSASGKRISYRLAPGVSHSLVRHLILDQVLPRVLSLRGKHVLHCSAILGADGRAVLFLGEAGQGKSTLATSFGLSGMKILTDDAAVLSKRGKKYVVTPTYSMLRLTPETHQALLGTTSRKGVQARDGEKWLLGDDESTIRFSRLPATLARMYLLKPQEVTSGRLSTVTRPEPLPNAEAVMALVKSMFRLDIADHCRLGSEFTTLADLAKSGTVWKLELPRNMGLLTHIRDVVLENLGEGSWDDNRGGKAL